MDGLVKITLGALLAVTATLTGDDVVTAPRLSVAFAVSV